jgi:hypothetical protein
MGRVDRMMQGLSIAGIILAILMLLGFSDPFGCSQSCTRTVKSEQEAHLALAAFFSSDTRQSRRLIASLREDGMTDEYFNNLKAGCPGCYVYAGHDHTEDPNAWYTTTHIAPSSAKKSIVLLIECTNGVWLEHRLYGG